MAKASGRKILRVGLIQNEKVLEERLLRKEETVSIGSDYKRNLLVLPASNLPKSFALFEPAGGSYTLQFTDKMEGRVSRGGSVQSFEELRSSGVAKKKGDVYQVKLDATMRGRVVIGEATVLFQFVTPPPVRPAPVLPASMRGGFMSSIDRPLAMLLLLSALIQIGFVVFVENQDWPVPEETEFRIPDRIARIMVEEKQDEPEPEEIELEETEEGEGENEGEAAPQQAEPAPSKTPEEVADARQEERLRLTEEVRDATVLRVLTADGEGGESAIARVTDSLRNLGADEAFAGSSRVEYQAGGGDRLALGRGDSEADGVGTRADIGEIGSTKGASKAKDGVDTGKREETTVRARPVQIQNPDDAIGGTLDQAAVSRALRQIQRNIQDCYERELRRNNSAQGTVRVLVTVSAAGSRGRVSDAKVAADGVGGGVGQCVAQEIQRRLRVPAPEGGDSMFTLPFVFSPGG
ncbi:AgmX/PglI C-terminal domain-containing protein [Lujinxingia vulgaris]|nr:AgmX/PglI C-terminal domain-containing protein [Lujinxingia vulgaris]